MLIFEKNNKLYISFNNKVDEPNLEVNEEGVTVLSEDENQDLKPAQEPIDLVENVPLVENP